jgi:hypothetical protein
MCKSAYFFGNTITNRVIEQSADEIHSREEKESETFHFQTCFHNKFAGDDQLKISFRVFVIAFAVLIIKMEHFMAIALEKNKL